MKLAFFVATVSATATNIQHRQRRQDREVAKRYSQLIDQMTYYNTDFDERKYWTYGCHCLMLGDRPMSDMGKGAPMDALDSVCRAYKECQKCARQQFGDMCIGEFVRYDQRFRNGDSECTDDANTCGRALCECDRKFSIEHVAAKSVYTDDYHMFWSSPMFDNDAQCQPNGGSTTDPQCCQAPTGDTPFVLYNALHKECCADGSVQSIGAC